MTRPIVRRDVGFTLVELLVAMAVGLVVVLAAVAALTVSRTGFTTVDSASQLRDSGRFAADMIQRIGVQTGFRDAFFAAASTPVNRPPDISGFDNAKVNLANPLTTSTPRVATEAGYGSDVLILRYQAARLYPVAKPDGTPNTQADQGMIDCAGNAASTVPDFTVATAASARMASIFSVDLNQGEPSLMCTSQDPTTGNWSSSPIVQGVENFQVLYGVDGVTAGAAPAAGPAANVPLQYLRADQMVVTGDTAGTNANWERVRSLRIGMVLRSAPGSTQGSSAKTFYPFGTTPSSAGGAAGSAFGSSADVNTIFSPTPDGRLRQVLTFTIHLRNNQGL
jgi:type IV pilus assembly protein PilW